MGKVTIKYSKSQLSKKRYPFKKIFLAVVLVAVFLVGTISERYQIIPSTEIIASIKGAIKQYNVNKIGRDNYVSNTLDGEYQNTSSVAKSAERTLVTSKLPLAIQEIILADSLLIASKGSALGKIGETLIIMDRLGGIFAFDGHQKRQLDWGKFPNNLEPYVESVVTVQLFEVKALYLSFDSIRNTMYATLQKYVESTGEIVFNLSSLQIDPETLESDGSWQTIFETTAVPTPRGGSGGRIVISQNKLYFSVGDFGVGTVPVRKEELVSQDPNSPFGKIFELDLSTQEIGMVSMGHRNVQGLILTSDSLLLSVEHGPEGGDELNMVQRSHNYGWPYKTHGTDYGTYAWDIVLPRPEVEFTEPMFAWVPSIAASPAIEIVSFSERWKGNLIVGSLKAQSLFRLFMNGNRVIYAEPIWIGKRIRDLIEIGETLFILTDDASLLVVTVDQRKLVLNKKSQTLVELNESLKTCVSCHHFGETNSTHLAPSLGNIMGRPIASDGYANYSAALKSKVGSWNDESIKLFLSNPSQFAPGTTMPNLSLSDDEVKNIIKVLKN